MAELKRFEWNRPEYGIYMNERAFGGTAINTIGFFMRFPVISPEVLCAAVDRVIKAVPVFDLMLTEQDGSPCFTSTGRRKLCGLGTALPAEEAAAEWERLAAAPMNGEMYEFRVGKLTGGGSYLTARFHHIILDGYDMCKLARRILYELMGARTEEIGGLTRYMPAEADVAAERSFWLNYFFDADYEPFLIPVEVSGVRRNRLHLSLGVEMTAQIRTFAAERSVTEASVFAAALSLYLARASQKRDAVFVMPRLGRDNEEERAHYGCHTTAVPVRVTVGDDMTFPALCAYALEQAREASAHKDYGIDRILSDLKNGGIVNGAISEYTLNFYRMKLPSLIPYDIDMSMDGAMHNHLTLNITSFDGVFEITYDMRDGVYDGTATRRFHDALLHIISTGMTAPKRPVGEIEIVGKDEQTVLKTMCGKEIAVSDAATIPSLFRRAAQDYAEKPALYAGECAYTFAELDKLSNRVANALIGLGIRQGETVMYKLRRDEKLIPVMLGISKAGAAFIPIDPEYPEKRIDYIQENSGSTVMIVNDPGAEKEDTGRAMRVIAADALLCCADQRDPMLDIPQEQLAYCIYTSGTTGVPKGAKLSHRGIVNITHSDNNPFNRDIVSNGTGIVAIGSVCFDISLFEFFVPLFNGKFVEFAPERAMADPEALAALIEKHGANMLHCTPSRLSAYLKNARFTAALKRVEVILAAGEALPGSLVTELKDTYGIRVYNGYGPTETTIGATITEAGDNTSIGTPIANTGVMILDEKGRLLPYGVIGELYIYGKGLGLGYQNLPDETKKRFTKHYGVKMYKTGDLARFLPDRKIAYHGRNDFQVKIHGLRIELPEIESCIRSFEGIAGVCVQVRRIGVSEHLAAFYCVKDGAVIDPAALKEYVRQHLTYYMVPDIFKELDRIPETPSGKIDTKALAAIPVTVEHTYRAPQTPYQRAICEAFGVVLGLERVGLDDNFFDCGGDSLHTAELIYEIGDRLPEAQTAYEDVFRYPTPELLAQYLYIKQTKKDRRHENPLEGLDYDGIPRLLSANVLSDGAELETHGLGNVLLTGASGFLGVHVLAQLLRRQELWSNLYCLIRPSKRQNAEKRLKSTLFYYEEISCDDLYGRRLFALDGDISVPAIFNEPFDGHIDTVINCAANVSHFAFDDKLESVNTGGVKNLTEFCVKHGAALVQVSTISVGGAYESENRPLTLTERDLFIGQEIKNQYVLSKYMAEYEALMAAVKKGIPVKIMRVGNLQGRVSDGEFQMNRKTNAFTRQIASYVKIGKVSESLYRSTVNFSPVDDVAKMIVALTTLPATYSVFHVYPPKEVGYRRLFSSLGQLGHEFEVVSDEEFERTVKELSGTEKGRMALEGIFVERPDLRYLPTAINDEFTRGIIAALQLEWNEISDEYLDRYFRALEALGTFDE